MAKPKKVSPTPPPPLVEPPRPRLPGEVIIKVGTGTPWQPQVTIEVGTGVTWQPLPPQPQPKNTLGPAQRLLPGDCLISNNGQWKLEFLAKDGNMILWNTNTGPGNKKFSTETTNLLKAVPNLGYYNNPYPLSNSWIDPYNYYCHFCEMRVDGNFVMYQGVYKGGTMPLPVVFQSGTSGNNNAFLRLEDDGKLAIYKFIPNSDIWHK